MRDPAGMWLPTGDAARLSAVHRTVPMTENYPAATAVVLRFRDAGPEDKESERPEPPARVVV